MRINQKQIRIRIMTIYIFSNKCDMGWSWDVCHSKRFKKGYKNICCIYCAAFAPLLCRWTAAATSANFNDSDNWSVAPNCDMYSLNSSFVVDVSIWLASPSDVVPRHLMILSTHVFIIPNHHYYRRVSNRYVLSSSIVCIRLCANVSPQQHTSVLVAVCNSKLARK